MLTLIQAIALGVLQTMGATAFDVSLAALMAELEKARLGIGPPRSSKRPLAAARCPSDFDGLLGVATGRHRRTVAEVATDLFEWHPVVDQKGRGGVPDPMRAERSHRAASGVVAAGYTDIVQWPR